MGALDKAREAPQMNGPSMIGPLPIGAGKKIFEGALVSRDDATGFFEPGSAATGKTAFGVARIRQFQGGRFSGQAANFNLLPDGTVLDNTDGADGDLKVMVQPGVFKFLNKGGDLVTAGADAYIEDDQTVRATGTATSKAGVCIQIDPDDGGAYVLVFCPNAFV